VNINMSNGSVTIDGVSYSGKNIQVNDGKIVIDGVIKSQELAQVVNVVVNGDVIDLENGAGNVTAINIGAVSTGSGDVKCGDISGSVRTGSGDIDCGKISGSVRTGSGDINNRWFK